MRWNINCEGCAKGKRLKTLQKGYHKQKQNSAYIQEKIDVNEDQKEMMMMMMMMMMMTRRLLLQHHAEILSVDVQKVTVVKEWQNQQMKMRKEVETAQGAKMKAFGRKTERDWEWALAAHRNQREVRPEGIATNGN